MHELLKVEQMREADRLAIASGIPGIDLMEHAGRAVFRTVERMARTHRAVLVACGPGNNGGDGFVVARLLAAHGHTVTLALAGEPGRLSGDSAIAFARWSGPWSKLAEINPSDYGLVVDALLGAGLDRPVEGQIGRFIYKLDAAQTEVVSVDLPSGIHGDTGQVMGRAVNAFATVTFFRRKPGHLLLPGRLHCGDVSVADIAIPAAVLGAIAPQMSENAPETWSCKLPAPRPDGHKYSRGHAVVVSGPMRSTGAARMAAMAALRVGAGLVTLASPPDALAVNAGHLTEVMLAGIENSAELDALLADNRITGVALGPALGIDEKTRLFVKAALAAGKPVILDADALTAFTDDPNALFKLIGDSAGPVVLTPHAGEFRRLFAGHDKISGKAETASAAAVQSGAVMVLKGADTVIAAPDGRIAIYAGAPPWLATAGAGDVLTGLVCGLAAQGMPVFEAACAGAWIHGAAATRFGPGMIAGDVIGNIPAILGPFHQS